MTLNETWEQFFCWLLVGRQCKNPLFRLSVSSIPQSVVSDSLWPPWTAARQASLFITNSQSLLKLMSIESVMPSNHLILCYPLLFLLSIYPRIKVFSSKSVLCIRWLKYWSFSFCISISHHYLGLISFRIDWLDLLAVQGALKSLLQYHNLKTSILQCSVFFMSNSHICTQLLKKP